MLKGALDSPSTVQEMKNRLIDLTRFCDTLSKCHLNVPTLKDICYFLGGDFGGTGACVATFAFCDNLVSRLQMKTFAWYFDYTFI